MEYDAPSKESYGHLSLASDSTQCLTAYEIGESDSQFLSYPCSISDDSSQLFQYFVLAEDGHSINFLGEKNGSHPNHYQLSLGTDAERSVLLTYNATGADFTKGVRLSLF